MNKNIRHNIGDKVVALDNTPNENAQFRVKGNVYIVQDISYCRKCGQQTINIGQTTTNKHTNCYECKTDSESYNKFWTLSYKFIKVDDIEEILTEAINNEDYELASTLRDVNK